LSSLTVSNGVLPPAFDAETVSYSVYVDNSTTALDLTAVLAGSSDQLSVQGQI